MSDDIDARLADIERRLAALEEARAEPAAHTPWVMPEWLEPLDESFKSGSPAEAISQADKLRAEATAAGWTTQLEELRTYLATVPVAYPALGRVMSAIDRDLETLRGITRGPQRRTDDRPFPAPRTATPADESVPAAGDGSGDAGER